MPKYVYAFYARINPNNVSRNIIIEMHLFFEILGRIGWSLQPADGIDETGLQTTKIRCKFFGHTI